MTSGKKMRFRNDDFQNKKPHGSDLTETVKEEHPKHFVAVAEEQIRSMHNHDDGSPVELHRVGSREFIAQSIQSSIEGKLTGNGFEDLQFLQKNEQNASNLNNEKIEYEKISSHDLFGKVQSNTEYGVQQAVTAGGLSHKQETAMVGCNCGAEWTVTGQSTKGNNPNNPAATVKVEQYGSAAGSAPGYGRGGGGDGGGPGEYRTGGGQRQEYRG